MKKLFLSVYALVLLTTSALADTPPPGVVKAKTFTGDGNTGITATGTSLNVNVTNSTPPSATVNQGNAGSQSWLTHVTTSALPANACVETGGHLSSIDSKLTSPLSVTGTFWQSIQPVSGTLTCNAGSGTQAVSLATLPALTTGSATIGAVNVNGTVPVSGTFWQTTQPVSGTFWQATQPVSGTVTANAGTGTFSVDASGHTVPVSGTFWQATQPVSGTVTANAGTNLNTSLLALETGGHLASIDAKLPSQGQALAADSLPVVLTAAQLTTLTPPSSVTVTGTVTSNIGTTNGLALDATVSGTQVAQASTTSGQNGSLVQGAVTTSAPSYTTAKTSPLSLTTAGALRVDNSAVTQTVSGTVTANAGTGTFTVDASGHTVPVSGTFWQATQPVSLTTLPALVAGSAIIGKVAIDQTTPGTTNLVSLSSLPSLVAGTAIIGKVAIDQTTPGTTNLVASSPVGGATDSQTTGTVSTVITLTAPSNAQGFILQNLQTSTANVRFAMGATATTSLGMQLAPGQDTGFMPTSANVSLVSESGTQNYNVQWIAR